MTCSQSSDERLKRRKKKFSEREGAPLTRQVQ
jgi:hypothetical protein